ncbi:MAG: AgmX/PglI C-terminal domain-containing protein [Kofleriaceae bacterium]|nr:AgmX/PglI C-terminal domain-containing protein [Kofleriaceae bacterium]MBP9208281.1 AgmX/PglI C-terminal domain-containing protein [Kofleriaceae bacterium]
MATAAPGQAQGRRRVLRVGILLNRTLVEERLMRERSTISVGQSAKNTFSIPLENLPRQFDLFSVENDHYRLNFTDQMDGRISDGAQPLRLSELKAKGENRGEFWSVPISDSTRGKIEMGDFTLLFQFVAEPPRQPKPMLPASVRGTLADRLDPHLTVAIAISVVCHFGIALYAMFGIDPPIRGGLAQKAYQLTFKQDVVVVEEPVEIKPDPNAAGTDKGAEAKEPDKGADKKPDKKPDKPAGGDTKPDTGGSRDQDDAVALAEDAAARAIALLGEDEDPLGMAGGDNRRSPGGDLSKQLDQVKAGGQQVTLGGNSGRGTRGSGDPRLGTGTGPKLGGQGGIDSAGGGKTETGPQGRISVADKSALDDTSLTPDAVMAKIMSAYMSALRRCYKDYLKKDPTARGKVTLSFTVNETGRSVSNRAKSDALPGEVTTCIQARMDSWRFPIPKDDDGPATAEFQISLQMIPD